MKVLSKISLSLLATIGLASCGGGGGGGSSNVFTPPGFDDISISAASTSIPVSNFTTLTVTVKKADGSIENDGTTVNASISPSTIGTVSGAAGQTAGTTASNTLSGGKTSFNFTSSNQAGTASITISLPAGLNGTPGSASKSIPITVTAGNASDPRLKLTPSSTTLPLNPFAAEATTFPFPSNFFGSPYIAEVALEWRHSNGQLVSGSLKANISIDKPTIATLSTLDDPATTWSGQTLTPPTVAGNEFLTLIGSGQVTVTAGIGSIYVHAEDVPGTAVLTVTATDPDNSQTISSQLVFTIAGAASNLPASITASPANTGIYLNGSNGVQSTLVTAQVSDGNGVPVADPSTGQGGGFDNVQFQITSANTDAKLVGLNAAGQPVSGKAIVVATHSGIAAVSIQAGSQQGPVQVKVTADRGDNNVDNGIQDPVSATTTVIISDGKLYSLTLTSPDTNAILINRVSSQAVLTGQSGTNGVTIPPDPNATYSLTVSVLGTDRQGNPVTPGTSIKFGSIDAPQGEPNSGGFAGEFLIEGVHGDPQEGGTLFTALDGFFQTAGGGAGPGDTLVVFGKTKHGTPAGNDDLESAVKIAAINSNTSLRVATPFNANDTTGTSVDNHAVLPYVIGRAQAGNISSPSTTNNIGVASTTLNYPVSALGRTAAIWAQSTSTDTVTGGANVVTDAAITAFPGVAPAQIVISPSPIPGNITTTVVACIYDALFSPLAGVQFQFSFTNLGVGSGTLDGISGAGIVPQTTDAGGCVSTTVTTTGIAGGGTSTGTNSPGLTFTAGSANKTAPITANGGLILLANPSSLGDGGVVTLTLLNSNGTPVPGVQLTGTCTGDASIGITSGPGITGSDGKTQATITADLNKPNSPGTGKCTFTTATGSPTATVNLQGVNICIGTSPVPAGCSTTTTPTTSTLTIVVTNNTTPPTASTVSSTPAGISCTIPASATQPACTASALAAGTYTLTSTAANHVFNGDCAGGTVTAPAAGGALICGLIISN